MAYGAKNAGYTVYLPEVHGVLYLQHVVWVEGEIYGIVEGLPDGERHDLLKAARYPLALSDTVQAVPFLGQRLVQLSFYLFPGDSHAVVCFHPAGSLRINRV